MRGKIAKRIRKEAQKQTISQPTKVTKKVTSINKKNN